MSIALWGIRNKGIEKLFLVRDKGEPECLGNNVLSFIKKNSISFLENFFFSVILCDEQAIPTNDDIKLLELYLPYFDKTKDFGYTLIECEQNFLLYKNGFRFMVNGTDSIMKADYIYMIDLDKLIYEVRKGKQKLPDFSNRYGHEKIDGRYPPKIIGKFYFNNLPASISGIDEYGYIIDEYNSY